MPLAYSLRPIVLTPKDMNQLELINYIIVISCDIILICTLGYQSIIYLVLSLLLGTNLIIIITIIIITIIIIIIVIIIIITIIIIIIITITNQSYLYYDHYQSINQSLIFINHLLLLSIIRTWITSYVRTFHCRTLCIYF